LRKSSQHLAVFVGTTGFYDCPLVRVGKLTAWKRLVKLSFLFIFALSIQGVWVFNIPE